MSYIVSYKAAQSFHIGMDIDEENTRRYTEAVIGALVSGHALLEEVYDYPVHSHLIAEHLPNSDQFFTYLDFKINSAGRPDTDSAAALEQLRESLIRALQDGAFELVILWRRNLEAHIVFELRSGNTLF